MKTKFFFTALLFTSIFSFAQVLKSLPPGGNKKATTSEQIGITDVTIKYDRPGVKGREGKIYGTDIVHVGYENLGFGTSKAAPWRAGANENTTIEFSTNVKIEGQELAAGKYGFFIAYDPNECTLIFSKNSTSWGSYFYDDKEDALRVKVKPLALDKSIERLKYEFMNQTENSAVVALQWEKLSIPFKVEVDLVNTQLDNLRLALRNKDGFRWEVSEQAATLCLQNNTSLEEGLQWSNDAISVEKNFNTLRTNAAILEKLGKKEKADSTMKAAMAMGSMIELHQHGRMLVGQKKSKEALEVFQLNAKKNPKQFTTYAGLTRGYSATGDYKTALVNAKAALALAPDELNKKSVQSMIDKLQKGQDVN
jgi:tetratricopeptide (TPR) repeat protein